ncbi:MAG TPA: acyl-ACP--UDP-N-acetylglucosamine O-acyltransferase [Kiloniellaceae bacterium]|nr:acyl-ACP--UDP-N-acetylglucosamine O-acyltransferase [Kiloniellaceae bacterium]
MPEIHPTAIVGDSVEIAADCRIGPYCVLEGEVSLAEGVRLHSHVVLQGHTTVGANTQIFPFASIGHRPQDLKYNNEASRLEIGADNVIREYVTMNPGTSGGGMVTRIGHRCLFMVGAHVAHDCTIGNGVILANNATLAGHVTVGDYAVIGGLSAVHQFVRVGHNAMIGGMSGVENDVIPYGMAFGERACLQGINIVGLKRGGIAREQIRDVLQAYETLFFGEGTQSERTGKVAASFAGHAQVSEILSFMAGPSPRALLRPK